MGLYTLIVTFLCTIVLPVLLFLAAVKLWEMLLIRRVDPSCGRPLPPGTMGLPFIGETLQLILQVRVHFYCNLHRFSWLYLIGKCDAHKCFVVFNIGYMCGSKHAFGIFVPITRCPFTQRRKFLRMKRQKYGCIYKTHLFGNPTVRVMGAENVRQILLGEHKLVSVQWPASVRTILGSDTLSNVHGTQHKNKKKVRTLISALNIGSTLHKIFLLHCSLGNWWDQTHARTL